MVGLKGGWASLGFSASNFVSKSIFCYRTQAKLLNEDEKLEPAFLMINHLLTFIILSILKILKCLKCLIMTISGSHGLVAMGMVS